MWSRVLEPGLVLLHGMPRALRSFGQELTHHALHAEPERHVLWCDGDHGFDPYEFAELNMVRGHAADDGADRILIKRCMTPFQWDSVLTQHLREKLADVEASLVLAVPFDRLFSTDEITDWEAEDYVRYATRHLRNLARRHQVPIVMGIDMARWWRTHPVLAQSAFDAADHRWMVAQQAGRWRLAHADGEVLDPTIGHRVTLRDFLPQPEPIEVTSDALVAPVAVRQAPRAGPNDRIGWRHKAYPTHLARGRTRIVHEDDRPAT